MDKMNTPVNVFLDLSKAFNTLDHEILLYKLKIYGINRASFKLMESYITNRKQYVEIEGINSEMSTLTTSVPQGSILGPLLFIIHINNIANSSKIFDFVIYADDTILSTTLEIVIRNTNDLAPDIKLNEELANVNDWLKLNKLSLNVKICKCLIYHMARRKVNPLYLVIDDTAIEHVSEFNFPGLTLDENLTYKSHINIISNRYPKAWES